MKPSHFRLGAIFFLLGFLFVFFAPIIYDATLYACHIPAGCVLCPACLSNHSGLESIGYAIAGWGATYSIETGYNSAAVQLGTTTLTTAGVFIFIALPIMIATLFLSSPELVRIVVEIKSRLPRRSGTRKTNPPTP